jgi:hypothetical protein
MVLLALFQWERSEQAGRWTRHPEASTSKAQQSPATRGPIRQWRSVISGDQNKSPPKRPRASPTCHLIHTASYINTLVAGENHKSEKKRIRRKESLLRGSEEIRRLSRLSAQICGGASPAACAPRRRRSKMPSCVQGCCCCSSLRLLPRDDALSSPSACAHRLKPWSWRAQSPTSSS